MGEFGKWLLHEDRKELFEYLFANALNAAFLALAALLLWPLGRAGLAWRMAKGYWLLWCVLILTGSLLALFHRALRADLYHRANLYVISGLVLGGVTQAGWSAFAAPAVRESAAGAPAWVAVVLYFVGVVSCYVACCVVGAFYLGTLYRFANLAVAAASFVLFALWPAGARATYGPVFDLLRAAYGPVFDLF